MAFLNRTIKTYFLENLVIGDVACATLRHTTMFTYSHANTPLGQLERVYYLSYFIKGNSKVYMRIEDNIIVPQ